MPAPREHQGQEEVKEEEEGKEEEEEGKEEKEVEEDENNGTRSWWREQRVIMKKIQLPPLQLQDYSSAPCTTLLHLHLHLHLYCQRLREGVEGRKER